MRKTKQITREATDVFYGSEPSFSYDHKLTRIDYVLALNWYSAMLSREDSKNYVVEFLRAQKNKNFMKKVQRLPHVLFSPTYGAIARMLSNDVLVPESGTKWLDTNLNKLVDEYAAVEGGARRSAEVIQKKPVDIQARTDARARAVAAEIDDIFEDNVWFKTKKLEPNHIYNFLHSKNVSGVVAQKVAELFEPHLEELKSIKKDPQLKEAYSKYSRADIKRFVDFYQNAVDTCQTFSTNTKRAKVRKPRAKKAIPLEKKIGKLRYLKLYNPFQLASVNPTKVLGASQVYLFNTKYTQLTVLNALDRGGIDVKGQTFKNVDEETSVTKKIGRKTKEVIDAILKSSKPQCRKTLEKVNAKPGRLQTRCNEATVIVRIFT